MIKTIRTISQAGVKEQLSVPSGKNASLTNNIVTLGSIFVSDSDKSLELYQFGIDEDHELKFGDQLILTSGDFFIYHLNASYKGSISLEYIETEDNGANFTGGYNPNTVTIENSLTSNATTDALSANMGRHIDDIKVDKIIGKSLSTEDYTTTEKTKLGNIADGANNYSLLIADNSTLGGVKIGSGLSIDANGVVHVNENEQGIGSLPDVDITTTPISNGQLLVWNGTKFIPMDNPERNTDLSIVSKTSTGFSIDSSTGNVVVIPQATTTEAGLISGPDKTKLDGIAENANNYSHPIGDGNLHVPSNGTNNDGKVLTAGAIAGTYTWENISSSSNMYTQDGVLSSDRTITLNGNSFTVEETNGKIVLTDTFADMESSSGAKTARVRVDSTGKASILASNGLSINGSVGSSNDILTSKGADITPVWESIIIANNQISNSEANTDWNDS